MYSAYQIEIQSKTVALHFISILFSKENDNGEFGPARNHRTVEVYRTVQAGLQE